MFKDIYYAYTDTHTQKFFNLQFPFEILHSPFNIANNMSNLEQKIKKDNSNYEHSCYK